MYICKRFFANFIYLILTNKTVSNSIIIIYFTLKKSKLIFLNVFKTLKSSFDSINIIFIIYLFICIIDGNKRFTTHLQ